MLHGWIVLEEGIIRVSNHRADLTDSGSSGTENSKKLKGGISKSTTNSKII
jgi:hypothetical protein